MSDTVEGLFDDSDDGQYSDDNQASRLGTRRKNQDYSDESDNEQGYQDEEDEDFGYDNSKRNKPKKKRQRTNNFLDIEASVETDEDEDDDDGAELGDFIEDNEAELASAEKDALRHRSSMRPAVFQDDDVMDAEAMEARLRERYSGYATSSRREAPPVESDWMPQRLLLPGINDPHLWMARCIPGKERDALLAAARRIFN
ncbi:transcription elongation factor spt5, partial [Linderina macrospora]